jgi:hypothetical protein
LAFTLCQTPVVYINGASAQIEVSYADGHVETLIGNRLDRATSRHILARDGQVRRVQVTLDRGQ